MGSPSQSSKQTQIIAKCFSYFIYILPEYYSARNTLEGLSNSCSIVNKPEVQVNTRCCTRPHGKMEKQPAAIFKSSAIWFSSSEMCRITRFSNSEI
jgi:hypothetical protein